MPFARPDQLSAPARSVVLQKKQADEGDAWLMGTGGKKKGKGKSGGKVRGLRQSPGQSAVPVAAWTAKPV